MLSNTSRGDPRQGWLHKRGIPFAAFGRAWGSHQGDWVDVDGAAGTAAATDHLIGLGHRKIALSRLARDSRWATTAPQAGARRCAGAGCPPADYAPASVDNVDAAAVAVAPLLDAGVTAVVCGK